MSHSDTAEEFYLLHHHEQPVQADLATGDRFDSLDIQAELLENKISQGLEWWELLNWVAFDRKSGIKAMEYIHRLVTSLREHRSEAGDKILTAVRMYAETVYAKAQMLQLVKPYEADLILPRLAGQKNIKVVRFMEIKISNLLQEEKKLTDRELGFESGWSRVKTWGYLSTVLHSSREPEEDEYDGYDEYASDFVKGAYAYKGRWKSEGAASRQQKEQISDLIALAEEGKAGVEVWMPEADQVKITDGEVTVSVDLNEVEMNLDRLFIREGNPYQATGLAWWSRQADPRIRYISREELHEKMLSFVPGLKEVYWTPRNSRRPDGTVVAGWLMLDQRSDLPLGWVSSTVAPIQPGSMVVNCSLGLEEGRTVTNFELVRYCDRQVAEDLTIKVGDEVVATFDGVWSVVTQNRRLVAYCEKVLSLHTVPTKKVAVKEASRLRHLLVGYAA